MNVWSEVCGMQHCVMQHVLCDISRLGSTGRRDAWSWRWWHHNSLKHQRLLTPWQSVTSQKTWIFGSNVMRTWNLTNESLFNSRAVCTYVWALWNYKAVKQHGFFSAFQSCPANQGFNQIEHLSQWQYSWFRNCYYTRMKLTNLE
jgi:hypothetical protein